MTLRHAAAGLVLAFSPLAITPAAQAGDSSTCQFTQGYWQNRAQNAGGETSLVWTGLRDKSFYLSGTTYAEVLTISPRGNEYWILAHQLVAAEANWLSGADDTDPDLRHALDRAKALMALTTPEEVAALPKDDPDRIELVELSRVLDDWNNGWIGSGVCSDRGNNN